MGIPDMVKQSTEAFQESRERVMRQLFEPELAKLGLDRQDIDKQSREQLEQSLQTLNDAIRNPQIYGVVHLKYTGDGVVITDKADQSHVEVGILPLLLERKQLILNRLAHLKGEEKFDNLRDLIASLSDNGVREKLTSQVEQLESEDRRLREQQNQVDQAQQQESLRQQAELNRVRLFQMRTQVWQSWVARESVATIVGGALLLLMAIALLIAMFIPVEVSAIVNNSFLVILGYFFGQAVGRTSTRATNEES